MCSNGKSVIILSKSRVKLPFNQRRLSPSRLTPITPAAGLVPMLFETSTQALYLIPMVISLSFGTVFSMVIILLLIPALFSLRYRNIKL